MLTADWFEGKRITVMGLGLHGGGLATAKWLVHHGAIITVTDMKDQHALAPSIATLERFCLQLMKTKGKLHVTRTRYVLGRHEEADFRDTDMVIRNPAVPREHPLLALAAQKGVPIETDVSIFFQLCPYPIAAVSGTKGKTTTTALLAAICKAWDKRTVVGGNIRLSPLEAVDRLLRDDRRALPLCPIILELSSWQLESLERHAISPHIGVLTNIKEDHLNRYRGMEDYAAAKELLVRFQHPDDVAVLNADDARVAAIGGRIASRTVSFSLKKLRRGDGVFLDEGWVTQRTGRVAKRLFAKRSIRLPGEHNAANVLAATAAALVLGVPVAIIKKTVAAFHGVAGRLEPIATIGGVAYINDTTATAPDATIAALQTYAAAGKSGRIVLIAGGADKQLPFVEWAKAVKAHVKHLVLFDGSATEKMEAQLAVVRSTVPMAGARAMPEAVREAMRHARRGDIVLLSPGCASFGLFQHEFDRGDQFVATVRRLGHRRLKAKRA